MPYLKLDCAILDSTLWFDREAREIFLTALLMAVPRAFKKPMPQLAVRTLDASGWAAPAGDYGFVASSGPGIVHRALVDLQTGLDALERLGQPDPESRSQDFEGRRLVRIDGGYLALNFDKYRFMDHTNAERQKRWRDRQKNAVTSVNNSVTPSSVTQAEAEASADAFEAQGSGGYEAPRQPMGPASDLRRDRWVEREGEVSLQDGPRARHDPMQEKIPFADWFPSQQLLQWASDIGLTEQNFDVALSDARDKLTGKHTVEWYDGKIVRFVNVALLQQKGIKRNGKPNHRQPSRGNIDPNMYDADRGEGCAE